MGQILSSFTVGWPGSISRNADDIVISQVNRESTAEIAFGAPVWLSSDGKGVRNWASGDTMTNFVGFAVRSPSKTPDVYPAGSSQDTGSRGSWKPGEPVDVLVRGCMAVQASGSPRAGGQVYLDATTGRVTASAGTSNLALTGVHFRKESSSSGSAEIVLTQRTTI